MILLHDANPSRMEFSERTGRCPHPGPRMGSLHVGSQSLSWFRPWDDLRPGLSHIAWRNCSKLLLDNHGDIIKAAPSDRPDQSFAVAILP